MFRRRRDTGDSSDIDDVEGLDVDGVDEAAADDADPERRSRQPADQAPYAVTVRSRPSGPWDFHDVPDDDEVPRVDLGGILVPVPEGLEVRVEVQDDVPVAATLVEGSSALQVHAFAAPKSSGLWDEVRAEIAQSLRGAGGTAEDAEGPFGAELRARLPVDTGGTQPARFLGVDGPRWFLRGLLTGPASTDPNQARQLEAAFRQVVVNRGNEAMAPRDMLPLHLPRDVHDAAQAESDLDSEFEPGLESELSGREPEGPPEVDRSLRLPERGPEITEIQ